MKTFIIIIWLILGHLTGKSKQECLMSWKRTQCKCTNVSFVPPLPRNISKLIISRSVFREITKTTFSNLTDNKIKELVLFRNDLRRICTGAFVILSELSTLTISGNSYFRVNEFKSSLSVLNISNIRKLAFTKNSWTTLPPDMFIALNSSSLDILSLNDNHFSMFNLSVLSPIKFLTRFTCDKCNIVHLNTHGDVYIQELYLKDNSISVFPDFCQNVGIKQHLIGLHLSQNALTLLWPEKLACLKNLQKLYLDSNPIKTLVTNTFVRMPRLNTLHLNLMPNLRTINGNAFASKSLRSLRLQRSFHFYKVNTYRPELIFDKIPNLSLLDLAENVLPNLKYLTKMFSHLKSLRTLTLPSARIWKIPDGFFQLMPQLKSINLRGNKISKWKPDTFLGMKEIEKLDLSGNSIKLINSTSFPKTFLDKVKILDLGDNPFSCTCDLKWFLDLLKTKNISSKLKNWPGRYVCRSPKSRKNVRLVKYNPTDSECSQLGIIYIITIVVCSLVISFFLVILGICNCQSNIKNLIYFVRLQMLAKKGYSKIQNGSDFMYHVFVVYCEDDRVWVHQTLLQKLEREGLTVCVHHRDFDVGKPITENITDCMNNSWKVLVVLSNRFAKSEWCLWELDLVQERRRRVGNEAVIVLVYQEIDSRHMTSRLRSLLITSSSLKYNDGIGKHLFWKAVMKNINRPLSTPPTSQL